MMAGHQQSEQVSEGGIHSFRERVHHLVGGMVAKIEIKGSFCRNAKVADVIPQV